MARATIAARDWVPLVAGGLTLAALAHGLSVVPEALEFSAGGALAGIADQLDVTLPAALLAGSAAVLNLAAGAVLYGLVRGERLNTLSETLLGGLAGAVLLDAAALYVLGGAGWFSRPLVAGMLVLVVVLAALFGRLPRMRRLPRPGRWWPIAVVVALVWCGPIIVQLASPVVPFGDVLPNHVAPVQHLSTFGRFDPLTTTPSPNYGPSRTLVGYVALLGTVATITALPAALATAAFILPQTVLVAAGIRLLAGTIAGPGLGIWILLAFAMTQPFARLTDDRARIVALPLAAWSLVEFLRAGRPDPHGVTPRRAASVGLCLSLSATLLMHPVIGTLNATTILVATVASPARHARHALPALAGAAVIAVPQATTMLDVPLPGAAALATTILGICVAGLSTRAADRLAGIPAVPGRVGAIVVAGVVAALAIIPALRDATSAWSVDLYETMPLLGVAAVAGMAVGWRRLVSPVLVAGVAVAVLAGVCAYAISDEVDLIVLRSIRFEVPKTVLSWAPIWVAVGAAVALAAAAGSMTRTDGRLRAPRAVLGGLALAAFLFWATVPIREAPIDRLHTGERRLSESLATHLRVAEHGVWTGYPDARALVDQEQTVLLDVIRREILTGRIGHNTAVLHVAESFQAWRATPLAVFTGVIETMVSEDAEESIHTAGGRLYPLTELHRLLAPGPTADRFSYVVLERDGLPSGIAGRAREAGYVEIFSGARGTIYRLEDAPGAD